MVAGRGGVREEGREIEGETVNSVRTIVLPCGKVTKEKCEGAHRREGVYGREVWRERRDG